MSSKKDKGGMTLLESGMFALHNMGKQTGEFITRAEVQDTAKPKLNDKQGKAVMKLLREKGYIGDYDNSQKGYELKKLPQPKKPKSKKPKPEQKPEAKKDEKPKPKPTPETEKPKPEPILQTPPRRPETKPVPSPFEKPKPQQEKPMKQPQTTPPNNPPSTSKPEPKKKLKVNWTAVVLGIGMILALIMSSRGLQQNDAKKMANENTTSKTPHVIPTPGGAGVVTHEPTASKPSTPAATTSTDSVKLTTGWYSVLSARLPDARETMGGKFVECPTVQMDVHEGAEFKGPFIRIMWEVKNGKDFDRAYDAFADAVRNKGYEFYLEDLDGMTYEGEQYDASTGVAYQTWRGDITKIWAKLRIRKGINFNFPRSTK